MKRFFITKLSTNNIYAIKGATVKPPIQIFGLEGRYAHALYSAAVRGKKENVVEKDLDTFANLLKKDKALHEFVNDPTLKRKSKLEKLNTILLQQKFDKITMNFFEVLADNNRLSRVKNIGVAFSQLMSASRGEIECTVISAQKLDANNTKALETALKGFLKPSEVLKLNLKVDNSLLGGLIVELKDKYIDMSTATKIRKISNILKQAI
ncbi:hypothetical protein LOD99_12723 [Oopsacas minuta]|uniref:Oligomycin sensitivity conferral protein n=1 Tax=Oopsacas minuta TaxID=111878 RepID=A0AAV7JCW6_9METZ|nr:hypothetical protein LOD99_12723 [Oopsacas minuta]